MAIVTRVFSVLEDDASSKIRGPPADSVTFEGLTVAVSSKVALKLSPRTGSDSVTLGSMEVAVVKAREISAGAVVRKIVSKGAGVTPSSADILGLVS